MKKTAQHKNWPTRPELAQRAIDQEVFAHENYFEYVERRSGKPTMTYPEYLELSVPVKQVMSDDFGAKWHAWYNNSTPEQFARLIDDYKEFMAKNNGIPPSLQTQKL